LYAILLVFAITFDFSLVTVGLSQYKQGLDSKQKEFNYA